MKVKSFLLVLLGVGCISSCQKMGCTDENAVNYETIAKKNDGSCTYKGTLGIWFDSSKAQEYQDLGVTALTYFLQNKEKGTVSISDFSTIVPTCDSSVVFSLDFDLGKSPSVTYNLIVKRETGAVVDSYPVTVEGNKCTLFSLK